MRGLQAHLDSHSKSERSCHSCNVGVNLGDCLQVHGDAQNLHMWVWVKVQVQVWFGGGGSGGVCVKGGGGYGRPLLRAGNVYVNTVPS